MRIMVPVKSVAVPDEEFELTSDGLDIDPDFLDFTSNEWDPFAVEQALQMVEAAGGEVIVVTVGGKEAEEALMAALAMGADRAIRVDIAVAGFDPLAAARHLAGVVAREAPDLVLCGVQSSDAAHGATGVALAGLVDYPHIAVVKSIASDPAGYLTVGRELEGGVVQQMEIRLPAVLTVQSGINDPRYANLRAIKQARGKPLEVVDPASSGLEGAAGRGSGPRLRQIYELKDRASAEMIRGGPREVAERINEIIAEALR
ncbi:MAG: electron transfer flavoprotein subunit beta [Actinobacteria bacterium]|nr:electron transfer flavoprotein subunit beta [Actinomycetota bacterium]